MTDAYLPPPILFLAGSRRIALLLLLAGLVGSGCTNGRTRTSDGERLGPGTADISAEIESCAFDGEPYRCTVVVERTHGTGPQTPYPVSGSRMHVEVYASYFRDLTPTELQDRLEEGRVASLTVRVPEARGDPNAAWTVVGL